ncbi:MAG: hypothetical protein R3F34_18050 [Planctomycetota bacterium]
MATFLLPVLALVPGFQTTGDATPTALEGTLAVHTSKTSGSPDGTTGEFGTELTDVLVAGAGTIGPFDFEIAVELGTATGSVLDRAWVRTGLDDRHDLRLGRIRVPFVWSGFADEQSFVFPDRSRIGREFGGSDEGVELIGDQGIVDYRVALTNAGDGTGDARGGVARVGLHLVGERIVPGERPLGPDGVAAYLAYRDDGSVDQGDAFAAELHVQSGDFRVLGEFVDAAAGIGDQQGYTATVAMALAEGETEVALRLGRLAEPVSRTFVGLAYSQSFLREGVRGQLAVERVESSDPDQDGWVFSAGVVVAL